MGSRLLAVANTGSRHNCVGSWWTASDAATTGLLDPEIPKSILLRSLNPNATTCLLWRSSISAGSSANVLARAIMG